MRLNLTKYLSLGLLVVFITSCSNIEITKRRYRPGYHIDLVKKKEKPRANEVEVAVEEPKTNAAEEQVAMVKSTTEKSKAELRKERKAERKAQKAVIEETVEEQGIFTADASSESEILEVKPFEDIDKKTREKALTFQKSQFGNKLRKALKPEGGVTGWSVVAIISAGLGILAFIFLILAIIGAASALAGNPLTAMWTFGAVAAGVGLGAMITGIIGLRDTRDKRGRGFALAGMIAGILGLVLGLIFLIWGVLFDFVLDESLN